MPGREEAGNSEPASDGEREAERLAVPALDDQAAPLSWRQDAALSGYNMLTLGILHETLSRWTPPPVRVQAQVHAFVPARIDPESGVLRPVGTPDSVQVLTALENGARAVYHFSGATPFGQGTGIYLYGSEGVRFYTRLKTVTARWPTGIRAGAEYVMPTMR